MRNVITPVSIACTDVKRLTRFVSLFSPLRILFSAQVISCVQFTIPEASANAGKNLN